MRRIICIAVILLSAAVQAQMRELSFYEVKPAPQAPVIDGKLDDACWQNANRHTAYYEYFKPNPGPGVLKTEFRMLYDHRGIYLAVINYEENIAGIRKNITDRDNPQLWTDDCAEIYFDHYANGIGFYKFNVNSLGTVGDMRQVDGAVSLPEWNGNGWTVKTSINSDNWTIEAFFPWDDLGAIAQPGKLWMFCHIRYSFVGDKFRGVTSSPGGSYAAPGNFGYLYFAAAEEQVSPERVAQMLKERVSPPWGVNLRDQLVSDLGQGIRISSFTQLIREQSIATDRLVAEMERFKWNADTEKFHTRFETLKADYRKLNSAENKDFPQLYRALAELYAKLDTLKWQIGLEEKFNQR